MSVPHPAMHQPINPRQANALAQMLPYVAPWLGLDQVDVPAERPLAFEFGGQAIELRRDEHNQVHARVVVTEPDGAVRSELPLTRQTASRLFAIAAWVNTYVHQAPEQAAFEEILRTNDPDLLGAALAFERLNQRRWFVVRALENQLSRVMPGRVELRRETRLIVVADNGRCLAADGSWTHDRRHARLFASEEEVRQALRGNPEIVMDNVCHTEAASS